MRDEVPPYRHAACNRGTAWQRLANRRRRPIGGTDPATAGRADHPGTSSRNRNPKLGGARPIDLHLDAAARLSRALHRTAKPSARRQRPRDVRRNALRRLSAVARWRNLGQPRGRSRVRSQQYFWRRWLPEWRGLQIGQECPVCLGPARLPAPDHRSRRPNASPRTRPQPVKRHPDRQPRRIDGRKVFGRRHL